jgi:hypothetical protein
MSTLTATLLKKMLATAEGDCKELEKPLNYTPPKQQTNC